MIAFHGTNSEFDSFDPAFFGQNTGSNASDEFMAQTARIGFWFTENRTYAAEIHDKVMVCELAIENPYHVDSLENLANWIEMTEGTAEDLRNMLIADGYDAIIVDYDEEFGAPSYVAFSADQITIL